VKEDIMTDQPSADNVPEESLKHITLRLDGLIQAFEQHPIIQVRDQVMEMLSLIDSLHRQGVQHLVEVLQAQGSTSFDKALVDPAVQTLLTLYDLMPPEPREHAEQVIETLGPYIAAQGASVEVLEVVDGVVYLCLSDVHDDNAVMLKQTIETQLRENFPGFRSLELRDQSKLPAPVQAGRFIPLQQIRTIKRPVFTSVAPVESFPPGTLKSIEVEGIRVLLCNLNGDVYAYRNACAGSALPLDLGQLKGYTLLCPWHNCLYDIRTGKRLDGESGRLTVIPVALREGMIQLALAVEPVAVRVQDASAKLGGG